MFDRSKACLARESKESVILVSGVTNTMETRSVGSGIWYRKLTCFPSLAGLQALVACIVDSTKTIKVRHAPNENPGIISTRLGVFSRG